MRGEMRAARTFRDLRVHQKMESDWRSIAAMLARMIDRTADFGKDPPIQTIE